MSTPDPLSAFGTSISTLLFNGSLGGYSEALKPK